MLLAGADEVAVSVTVIYPGYCRPELVLPDPFQRICGKFPGIWMVPGI